MEERVEYQPMKGYGSFWVLIVLLVVLSVLVHVALWKWAVMKRIRERAKNNPPARSGQP
jgi:uncharacterized protein YneF (UPF0154 family)